MINSPPKGMLNMRQGELRERIKMLYEEGIDDGDEISFRTGITRSAVFRILSNIKSENASKLYSQKKTAQNYVLSKDNNWALNRLTQITSRSLGLSNPTVQMAPHDMRMSKLVPKPSWPLTDHQEQQRVLFCDKFVNEDFTHTFFTSETSYSIQKLYGPRWSCAKPRKIPSSNITAWGGISYEGTTTLSVVNGTINADKYIQILENHLLPSATYFYGGNWCLQQDHSAAHTAKITQKWIDKNIPQTIPWPALSADLSPIENMWLILANQRERENVQNFQEFQSDIVVKWNSLDMSIIRGLIDSMPIRLRACRDGRGKEINFKLSD